MHEQKTKRRLGERKGNIILAVGCFKIENLQRCELNGAPSYFSGPVLWYWSDSSADSVSLLHHCADWAELLIILRTISIFFGRVVITLYPTVVA